MAASEKEEDGMNAARPYTIGQQLLTIDQVCVRYDKPVLEGVSGTIDNIHREGLQQGQVVCLLGPRASAPQLFRCIAGLQRPSSGSIGLNGAQRGAARRSRRGGAELPAARPPHRLGQPDGGRRPRRRRLGARTRALPRAAGALRDGGQREELSHGLVRRPAPARGDRPATALQLALPVDGRAVLSLDPLAKTRVCETIAESRRRTS